MEPSTAAVGEQPDHVSLPVSSKGGVSDPDAAGSNVSQPQGQASGWSRTATLLGQWVLLAAYGYLCSIVGASGQLSILLDQHDALPEGWRRLLLANLILVGILGWLVVLLCASRALYIAIWQAPATTRPCWRCFLGTIAPAFAHGVLVLIPMAVAVVATAPLD